jgi:hypothetical protein
MKGERRALAIHGCRLHLAAGVVREFSRVVVEGTPLRFWSLRLLVGPVEVSGM